MGFDKGFRFVEVLYRVTFEFLYKVGGGFIHEPCSFCAGDCDSALLKRARISIFLSIRNKTKAQFNICASSLKRQNYPTKQQVSKVCLATERGAVAGLLLKGAFRAPIVGFCLAWGRVGLALE